jgi:defect-in-organelle-trafficking protein DotD
MHVEKRVRFSGILAAAMAALSLSACAQQDSNPPSSGPAWDMQSRRAVEDKLGESASRTTNTLETLAMIERARTEPPPSPISEAVLGQLPSELTRPTTIEWSGPAVKVTEQLARNIGYEFVVNGVRPSVEPMSHLSIRDLPAIKALESVGLQTTPYATVFVDPNMRRVEFRYEGAQAPLPKPTPARIRDKAFK